MQTNITTNAISLAIIIAIVEFVQRLFPSVQSWITIIVAAVVGGILGYAGIDGLNIGTGILTGLGAVGVHEVASNIGVNSGAVSH